MQSKRRNCGLLLICAIFWVLTFATIGQAAYYISPSYLKNQTVATGGTANFPVRIYDSSKPNSGHVTGIFQIHWYYTLPGTSNVQELVGSRISSSGKVLANAIWNTNTYSLILSNIQYELNGLSLYYLAMPISGAGYGYLRSPAVSLHVSSEQAYQLDSSLKVTASPSGGTYATSQTITLSCSDSNAGIYYTLDGSSPNLNSDIYQEPLTIKADTTLNAVAINTTSRRYGNYLTERYIIGGNTSVKKPVASPSGGHYDAKQEVTLTCETSGVSIYYLTMASGDTRVPTKSSHLYSAPLTLGNLEHYGGQVLKAIAYDSRTDVYSDVLIETYIVDDNNGAGENDNNSSSNNQNSDSGGGCNSGLGIMGIITISLIVKYAINQRKFL